MSKPPRVRTLLRRVRRASHHRRFPFSDFLREVSYDLAGLEPEMLAQRVGPNWRTAWAIVRHWGHTDYPPNWDAIARANRALREAWAEVKAKHGARPEVLIKDAVLSDAEDILRGKLSDDIAVVWRPWYHHHPALKQAIKQAQQPVETDKRKEPAWAGEK